MRLFILIITSFLFALTLPIATWADVAAGEVTIVGAHELTSRAVKTALKGVGINGTDQEREGRSVLRLFVDPLVDEWWGEWRRSNQAFQRILSEYADVEIPDTSSQEREVGVRVDVTLTGELEASDGALLTTLTGQGSASGSMVEYSSAEVDGNSASTWRNPDDMRRALERQALDQAARDLASQLAAYRGALVYQRPGASAVVGSAASQGAAPTSAPAGWELCSVEFEPSEEANIRAWLAQGWQAPVLVAGQVRGRVTGPDPRANGWWLTLVDPNLSAQIGDTYTVVVPKP